MASTTIKKTGLRRMAGLSTMALAIAGMLAPTVTSAQERGPGRSEARVDQQQFRNRSERMQAPRQQQPDPTSGQASPTRNYPAQDGWRWRQAPTRQSAPSATPQRPEGERTGWQNRDDRQLRSERRTWRSQVGSTGVAQQSQGSVRESRAPEQWRQSRQGEAWRGNRADGRTVEQWRSQRGDDRSGWQGSRAPGQDRARWQEGRRFGGDRESWRGGNVARGDRDNRAWDRGWRSNSRYDWSSYRTRNRGIYRPGRYHAPYNSYSYRRLDIGYTLGARFYGQNYWIGDPWSYRLPEVYGAYRWVRYYDDVLLVDTYSGEVVDVIYDFFF